MDASLDPDDLKQGQLVATISKKAKLEEIPETGQSNYYDKGTKIYSVKGNLEQLIAEKTNGEKEVLVMGK